MRGWLDDFHFGLRIRVNVLSSVHSSVKKNSKKSKDKIAAKRVTKSIHFFHDVLPPYGQRAKLASMRVLFKFFHLKDFKSIIHNESHGAIMNSRRSQWFLHCIHSQTFFQVDVNSRVGGNDSRFYSCH